MDILKTLTNYIKIGLKKKMLDPTCHTTRETNYLLIEEFILCNNNQN